MTVKQAGLDLQDPTKKTPENCTEYRVITGYLVAALSVQDEFNTTYHSAYLQ